MSILLTGGAGYIGSTVVSALLEAGHNIIILDNLSFGRIEFIKGLPYYIGDIGNAELLSHIFAEHPEIETLMHFAARIDVEESTRLPALYYQENVSKAITLVESALSFGVRRIVFSGSASVYAATHGEKGLKENAALAPLSPYARSKLYFEEILRDLCIAADASAITLRYFNPIGADPALRSGPYKPEPTHLLGVLVKSSVQPGALFTINGEDYATRDGTSLRDFVHVWDLARAHVMALDYLLKQPKSTFEIFNVGSGQGVTVQEFVNAFLEVSGVKLSVHVGPRRAGDNAGAYADISKAQELLGWTPGRNIQQGILDTLIWERHWLEQLSS